jgi:ABC-type transport system involved in multi-copper enzyme maturation permease subunit
MKNLSAAVWAEFLKVRRSRMPLFTALGFSLVPLMGGVFMIILKDPEFARNIGLLRTKAEALTGSADWPAYFGLLGQAIAVGGILLYALITAWVFGREFVDRTAKDFLALPTPASSIITAKFIVTFVWSAALAAIVYALGMLVGALIGLPQWSPGVAIDGTITLAVTSLLTIALVTPVAYVASAGHGYLPPLGFAIVVLVFAQALAAAGWGPLFPWSVAALYAGMGHGSSLEVSSYLIIALTSVAGLAGTFAWWRYADHTQ